MIAADSALLSVLQIVITVYTIVLFVKVLASWAPLLGIRRPISGPGRWALDLLDDVTEPVLRPLRAILPPVRAGGVGLDISVMVAFVILAVLYIAVS